MPWSQRFKLEAFNTELASATLIIGLLKTTYPNDADKDFLDNAAADDIVDHECDATNYARLTQALSATPFVRSDANDWISLDIADQTFSNLGGATNNDVDRLFIAKQVTVDTDHEVIATIAFPSHTTTNPGTPLTFNISELLRVANG